MSATGSIDGVAGSKITRGGLIAAKAEKVTQVNAKPNPYEVRGEHHITLIPTGPFLIAAGVTYSYVEIRQREPLPVDPPDPEGPEDCSSDESWNGEECIPMNCPIVISMDRGGYRFTSARRGVPFDLDASGAPEQVAWTVADSEVAFLALDRNGNGLIDSGAELFGNHTPVTPGTSATTPNGFEALRFAQLGAADDVLTANDPVWSQLLLWTDRNHNGLSEPDEIQRLCESGIVAISLVYEESRRVDRFGNEFRQRGTIQWADGRTQVIYDVWLRRER
jgi:hypothetical protein